jgi:hypothetical protein
MTGLWEVAAAVVVTFGAIVAIVAVAVSKVPRLQPPTPAAPSPDVAARLEALERGLQGLQHELADTQERLDFTERLLSQAREERRIGG